MNIGREQDPQIPHGVKPDHQVDPIADGVFPDVPYAVEKFIGTENVSHIETSTATITELTAQMSRPNPFSERNTAPKIGDVVKAQKLVAESHGDLPRLAFLNMRLAHKCASMAKNQVNLVTNFTLTTTTPGIHKIDEEILELGSQNAADVTPTVIMNLLDRLDRLSQTAATSADVKLLDDLLKASNRAFSVASTNANFGKTREAASRLQEEVLSGVEIVNIKKLVIEQTRVGQDGYELVKAYSKKLGAAHTAVTLALILELKKRMEDPELKSSVPPEEYQHTLTYLGGKETEIREAWSGDTKTLGEIDENIRTHITGTQRENLAAQPELPEEYIQLQSKINRARDISIGGGRLKIGKQKMQKTADQLQRISTELGENGLEPTQNGLMLAILADKFQEFIETLDILKSEIPSEHVLAMEQDTVRKQIHQTLRGIDLPTTLTGIEESLQTELILDQVQTVLSEGQIDKIKETIYTFLHGGNKIVAEATEAQLPEMEKLDWEVLSSSEGLERFAREIVEMVQSRSTNGANVKIDLSRLKTLEQLSAAWDKGKTHYAKGALKNRGIVRSEGQECADEYIVLTLDVQLLDGEIVTHAIAESPIVGPHALYVLRGDVAEFSWRDIYSMRKDDARVLTARRILHTEVEGEDLTDSMVRKVTELLSCNPEDFANYRFSSPATTRLGNTATSTQVKVS